MGRQSTYTPEMGRDICDRVALGDNIDRISQEDGYPSKPTIYSWLKKEADFINDYAQARTIRADARSDRIDDYGRQMVAGTLTPDVVRVLVDIEKWQAGKESSKYAEKQSMEVNHKGAVGVITADLSGLCGLITQLATNRAGAAIQGDVPDRPILPAAVRTE